MLTANNLVKKIKQYQTSFDEKAVIDAYNFSINAHSLQTRSSGEPYFSHPLSVAEILIELKLDAVSIITALLHDVVEDTTTTLEIIEIKFGSEIAGLVDGVTKLSKIENLAANQKAAENFRKLVVAMSQDLRVLLVKLADRLHNMRTINFISSEEKRKRISEESLAIYAPLAARIGMYKIRDELQELSFAQINPESRNYIVEKLNELKESKRDIIEKIISDLSEKIKHENLQFEIYGREKKPYSIWNKMKKKNVGFAYLGDIMAFRIIVDSVADCYKVLGIINSNYNMIPGSFKDYISTPKENGYKSLHLLILGPQNKKIEVQIRNQNMNQTAEFGVAAHWSYKENAKTAIENQQYKWIRDLVYLFEHIGDISEVMRDHKLHIHDDQVFCFTPTGDIFNLPLGATVVDFAYAIHSEIGNSCVGAKVNGIIAPLRQKLENGDQVEIATDKNAKPSIAWLQFVNTSKAKGAIKHFIKNEKYSQYSSLGKAIIQKFFVNKNLEINEELLEGVLSDFNKKTLGDFYVAVAEGLITRNEVLKIIYPNHLEEENKKTIKTQQNQSLPIGGLIPGMSIKLSECCHPIPGDNIIGLMHIGKGVSIHNVNCHNLQKLALTPQKVLDVCWVNNGREDLYQTRISVLMHNQSGSLAEVSNVIAKQQINISNIKISSRSSKFFEVIIDIEVKNSEHLESVISSLCVSQKIITVNVVN